MPLGAARAAIRGYKAAEAKEAAESAASAAAAAARPPSPPVDGPTTARQADGDEVSPRRSTVRKKLVHGLSVAGANLISALPGTGNGTVSGAGSSGTGSAGAASHEEGEGEGRTARRGLARSLSHRLSTLADGPGQSFDFEAPVERGQEKTHRTLHGAKPGTPPRGSESAKRRRSSGFGNKSGSSPRGSLGGVLGSPRAGSNGGLVASLAHKSVVRRRSLTHKQSMEGHHHTPGTPAITSVNSDFFGVILCNNMNVLFTYFCYIIIYYYYPHRPSIAPRFR